MLAWPHGNNNNDSGVSLKSQMGKLLAEETMKISPTNPLPGCVYDPMPYFLVGDEIFFLETYLIRQYPGSQLTEKHQFIIIGVLIATT